PAGARQHGDLAEGPRSSQQASGGMVDLLRLRNALVGLSGHRSSCLQLRPPLPRQTAQYERGWHEQVLGRCDLRRAWRAASATRAYWAAAVCLTWSQSESRMPEIGTSGLMS